MSVVDQFGDDPRPILEFALEQATPNLLSKAWVFQRVTEALEEAAFFLEAQQSTRLEAIFRESGLIQ